MPKHPSALITLLFLFLTNQLLFGQTSEIKGKITSAEDGKPIPLVNIKVKNSFVAVSSDLNGEYSITAKIGDVLVYSYVGYKTLEIVLSQPGALDVQLELNNRLLNETVVIGYGTQRKSQIISAVSSINLKEIKDQPTANLGTALQGRASGLSVVTPSGTPGAGLLINIRGNANPLYVVDGIPLLSESNSALQTSFDLSGNPVGSGQSTSSISDLNPNDIESVEVLKDASATAIYGARAANGVILITTKRGKAGKTNYSFSSYYGIQNPSKKIKFMDSKQFKSLIEEARGNDLALYNADSNYFGAGFDPSVLTQPLTNFDVATSPNTVWLDAVTQSAPISNQEISANGGSEKTKFYVSTAVFNQQGIVIESGFKRISYRLNLDHQASDKLSFGSNISVSQSKNRRSFNDNTYTGIITNALGASPFMPVYDANGNYSKFEDYQANWLSDNPVKSAKEIIANTVSQRLLGTVYADYKILPSLKFRTSWSADVSNISDKSFKSALTADAQAVGGIAYEAIFSNLSWLNENIFSLNKSINQTHNINAIVGFTVQSVNSQRSSITAQGFPDGGLRNISSAALITNATSVGNYLGIVSYLARVNYDFKNKLFASFSARLDGSSRFSKDNRYGAFPAISVGYRVFDATQNKFFSDLKIRASYGITGDQEIGDYQNISFYRPGRYYGLSGIVLRNIADPTLSWQSNKVVNLGLDYEILEGKFSGSIDVFKSNKTRLLSEDIVAGTTGFATVTRNSGEVQNIGVEFNLNYYIVEQKGFKWNANFNISRIKNEIKSLTSDGVLLSAYSDIAPTHILKVGYPVGSFWGLKYTGVNPANGDATFEDLDKNGIIDGNDAQIIGKAIPDFYGGLTNSISIGDFDVLIQSSYSVGNQVYNLIRPVYENLGWGNEGGTSSVFANNSVNVADRWKKPGDVAEYPRASFINQNYAEASTMFLENASFFRLQNLTAGYTFRNIAKVQGLRVYVQAQNLFCLSKYKGFDPEVSSTGGTQDRTAGVDYAAYPKARTLLFGLNINF